MKGLKVELEDMVHYRVGSLEKYNFFHMNMFEVHYRVGSLEMKKFDKQAQLEVHYRVGSLEIT